MDLVATRSSSALRVTIGCHRALQRRELLSHCRNIGDLRRQARGDRELRTIAHASALSGFAAVAKQRKKTIHPDQVLRNAIGPLRSRRGSPIRTSFRSSINAEQAKAVETAAGCDIN